MKGEDMKTKIIALKNAVGLLRTESSLEAISDNFQKITLKGISMTIKKIRGKL